MESRLAVPNAILFVFDPSNKEAIVPQYDPQNIIAATSSCVSVATLANVDGDVTARLSHLSSNTHPENLVQVFNDEIETPGKLLAIVTSQFDTVLKIGVSNPVTHIAIAVDDPTCPTLVSVNAFLPERVSAITAQEPA